MQEQFRGIPGDQDTDRRNEAKRLLASNPYLWFIGMTLPNGDTYFSEPFFSSQADSSKSNYGYRDHINGAIDSKSPYLSNVIISASTGQPLVVLASPVFLGKEANKNLHQYQKKKWLSALPHPTTRLHLSHYSKTTISISNLNLNINSYHRLQTPAKTKTFPSIHPY